MGNRKEKAMLVFCKGSNSGFWTLTIKCRFRFVSCMTFLNRAILLSVHSQGRAAVKVGMQIVPADFSSIRWSTREGQVFGNTTNIWTFTGLSADSSIKADSGLFTRIVLVTCTRHTYWKDTPCQFFDYLFVLWYTIFKRRLHWTAVIIYSEGCIISSVIVITSKVHITW